MRLVLIAGALYLGWRAMQSKPAPLPSPTPTVYPEPAYVSSGGGAPGVPGIQLSSLSTVPITSTATA